jgi:hypothetical protein
MCTLTKTLHPPVFLYFIDNLAYIATDFQYLLDKRKGDDIPKNKKYETLFAFCPACITFAFQKQQ